MTCHAGAGTHVLVERNGGAVLPAITAISHVKGADGPENSGITRFGVLPIQDLPVIGLGQAFIGGAFIDRKIRTHQDPGGVISTGSAGHGADSSEKRIHHKAPPN